MSAWRLGWTYSPQEGVPHVEKGQTRALLTYSGLRSVRQQGELCPSQPVCSSHDCLFLPQTLNLLFNLWKASVMPLPNTLRGKGCKKSPAQRIAFSELFSAYCGQAVLTYLPYASSHWKIKGASLKMMELGLREYKQQAQATQQSKSAVNTQRQVIYKESSKPRACSCGSLLSTCPLLVLHICATANGLPQFHADTTSLSPEPHSIPANTL